MTERSSLKTASFLLLLASITQGLRDVQMFHYKEALVGQNTSLSCFLKNISGIKVVGIEWRKKDSQHSKLALHMLSHGYQYFSPNVNLKAIKNDKDEVMGSNLELLNINKGDSGTYICDIVAFPIGTVQRQSELRIKDEIECDMKSNIEVNSGENVTIHCNNFIDVTYTWTKDKVVVVSDSSSLHLQSVSEAGAGLYTLTAHTGNSFLQKAFNITVATQTTAYWADASTLSPHLNSSSQSETTRYSHDTTFATGSTQKATTTIPILYSQSVNTQNTSASTVYHTSLSYNQSEASEGFTQSEAHNTTLRYNESESTDTVSDVRQHFNQSETFSYNHSATIHTTQPFVINTSTENASVIYDSGLYETEHPSKQFESTTSAPTTFLGTAMINPDASEASVPTNTPDTSDVKTEQDPAETEWRNHLVLILIIIGGVLLIIVAIILCRRRVIKKRMDLPPPFKPPPPPVKYAAVTNPSQPFPMDRCNSVTAQSSMDMKHTFV